MTAYDMRISDWSSDVCSSDLAALVSRIVAKHDVGAILHFAGSVVVPESVANPLKYYDNNSARRRTLIESAVTSGESGRASCRERVCKYVQISGVSVTS